MTLPGNIKRQTIGIVLEIVFPPKFPAQFKIKELGSWHYKKILTNRSAYKRSRNVFFSYGFYAD